MRTSEEKTGATDNAKNPFLGTRSVNQVVQSVGEWRVSRTSHYCITESARFNDPPAKKTLPTTPMVRESLGTFPDSGCASGPPNLRHNVSMSGKIGRASCRERV